MTEERQDRLQGVVSRRQADLVVVLEDVHDPHNAAAVFRSCDAFGIQDVYLVFDQVEAYNPRNVGKHSSSSTNKWLDFHIFSSSSECLSKLKEEGYDIVVTALEQRSELVYEIDFTKRKLALVFGNESRGVTKDVMALADQIVEIPMSGLVQSLNISVTAAILMYEVTKQRSPDANQYFRSEKEQEDLLSSFLAR